VLIIEKVIARGKRTKCCSPEESRNMGVTIFPIIIFVCANLLLKMGRGYKKWLIAKAIRRMKYNRVMSTSAIEN
jgi:hypothetical protein